MFCQEAIDRMTEDTSAATTRRWRKPKQARSLKRVNRILDVAEVLFIEQGYAAATTKQIAAQAEVPIGTLYQFFPDKAAIVQVLAERYTDLLDRQFQSFSSPEALQRPLSEYIKHLIEGTDAFFSEHPGYRAVFMEITASQPDTNEATDRQLIQTFATILSQLNESLSTDDCEAIAFVLIKAVGNLLWIASGQTPEFRQRLVLETQKLALHYLESYSNLL
ncbi:MAG: TetR/AcrR family transcriptional regulator [Cyanobacteria bacterium P01_G01_bin.4]